MPELGSSLLLLLMALIARRYREWLRDKIRVFNKRYLNPRTLEIAGRPHSPYAALQHTGRRSGRAYTTPVVAEFAQSWDGFVVPLPYGEQVDWCRNILATGRCTLIKDNEVYECVEPSETRNYLFV
ncbi:MAG: nitroreductase [Ktedonobacterales bacterium]